MSATCLFMDFVVSISGPTPHVKNYLLCHECETRFSQNGESEVLKWLAPKAKRFPLSERLKVALPREQHPDVTRYAASDFRRDAERFAYFALSVVWCGMARCSTGSLMTAVGHRCSTSNLIRRRSGSIWSATPHSLIRQPQSSSSCAVTPDARSLWTIPSQHEEGGCTNFRFMARGVLFNRLLKFCPNK